MIVNPSSFDVKSNFEGVPHNDLMTYINRYKQVSLMRDIENRFGTASYLRNRSSPGITAPADKRNTTYQQQGSNSKSPVAKPRPLAVVKRDRPTPGVGHYENA